MNLVANQALEGGVRPPIPPSTPWIGDILPAVAWALEPEIPWAAPKAAETYQLERAKQVVLILVDGLGTGPLAERLGYAATLRTIGSRPVVGQTCAPSTTAAAITSFATGQTPGRTNMVGYSVRFDDVVMNLLNFKPGLVPERWQNHPTFFERLAEVGVIADLFTAPKFENSGLTRAALRGARFWGRQTLQERFSQALTALRAGAELAFVYWADLDKVGHKSGPKSDRWAEALEAFDSELGKFLARLPRDVTVLLTADHGMVQVDRRVDIARRPDLSEGVEMIAGEGRAVHVHAFPSERGRVVSRWLDHFGDQAWMFTRTQMRDVIGAGPGVDLMGDLLVMPKGSYVIVDSRTQPAAAIAMEGVHGSLTEEEMAIPIWRLA